jgi:hypothetical protein
VTADSAKQNGPYTFLLEMAQETFNLKRISNVLNCKTWVFSSPYVHIAPIHHSMRVKRSFAAENQLFSETVFH